MALGMSLSVIVGGSVSGAPPWTSVNIDTSGLGPDVAVSPDGQAHVAYWLPNRTTFTSFSEGLMLASGDETGFATASLTTADLAYPSIAYDSASHLHLAAYAEGGLGGLVYMTDGAGSIASETVTTDALATAAALAVAPSGEVRIAYATQVDPGIYVATRGTAGWSSTRVADGEVVRVSLAIGADGASHLAWTLVDSGSGDVGIRYATETDGWQVRAVATQSGDVDGDIAVDAAGVPHIVFFRQGRQPSLAEVVVTGRHLRVVRLIRGTAEAPQVAFDGSGFQHISYFSHESFSLHHRTNASGRWVDTEVEFADPVSSLAVAPDGTSWIGLHQSGVCCPATGGILVAHD